MVAIEDIKKGETLFKIPRKLLLEPMQGSLSQELKEYDHWLRSIGRRYYLLYYIKVLLLLFLYYISYYYFMSDGKNLQHFKLLNMQKRIGLKQIFSFWICFTTVQ